MVSLVDLTKRGLEAHLQDVVLEQIIQEQLTYFENTLRANLARHVRAITVSGVNQMKDVLQLRDELLVKVDVEFNDVVNCAEEAPRHA